MPPRPTAPPRPAARPLGQRHGYASVGSGAADRTPGRRTESPADPRHRPHGDPWHRHVAAAACLVLGLGLLGGAAAGSWLDGGLEPASPAAATYARAGSAWHSIPVDELFPRTLRGEGAGPGGANRSWTRIAVAPDSGCGGGFDPLLARALAPVGCRRLLRATYADATSTSVTTVGLLITRSDAAGMRELHRRFASEELDERADLMPRPYAARGTAAAHFGDDQRASWQIRVLTGAPAVIYTVSGFADGRKVTDPQSAGEATRRGATSAPAESGLGNDARAIAGEIERAFSRALSGTTEGTS